jgi:hypothetical protein
VTLGGHAQGHPARSRTGLSRHASPSFWAAWWAPRLVVRVLERIQTPREFRSPTGGEPAVELHEECLPVLLELRSAVLQGPRFCPHFVRWGGGPSKQRESRFSYWTEKYGVPYFFGVTEATHGKRPQEQERVAVEDLNGDPRVDAGRRPFKPQTVLLHRSRPWFEPHLAKPDASRVPNSLLLFCVSNSEALTVLSGRQPHSPLEHLPKGSWVLVTDHTGNLVNGKR